MSLRLKVVGAVHFSQCEDVACAILTVIIVMLIRVITSNK